MSEKRFSVEEINNVLGKVFSTYYDVFETMTFSERSIVENVLIKLQFELEMLLQSDSDE